MVQSFHLGIAKIVPICQMPEPMDNKDSDLNERSSVMRSVEMIGVVQAS